VVNLEPQIQLDISDSCVFRSVQYTASDLRNRTAKWYWDFGNGLQVDDPVITKSYSFTGPRPLTLIAESAEGCKDTLYRPFSIYDNKAFAGRDTIAAKSEPVQLNAHGDKDSKYLWSPPTGLNDPNIENPIATLDYDQTYQLDVWTKEGCDSHSKIFIKRYKGPELYIPNAFTPNGDGKNDVLKVFPVGIKSFTFLAIYDRYGELIFKTTDYSQGWDGTHKGKKMDSGTFVAVAQAIDYRGKLLSAKGTVILVR
jgi:gliding motility-associated-like protein